MCITKETNKHLFGVTSKSSNITGVVVMVLMVVRQLAGQHLQMVFGMSWYGGGGRREEGGGGGEGRTLLNSD